MKKFKVYRSLISFVLIAVLLFTTLLATVGIIDNVDSNPENFLQFNGKRDLFEAYDCYMYLA